MLVGAVVVHHPYLFCAGTRTDERDLRGGDAPAGKAADDFVGKLVRELADLRIGGRAAVDLADDSLRRGAADIVEPAGNYDLAAGFGKVAEGHEIGVDLGSDPIVVTEFRGSGGHRRGVEAGADEIDYAAELQVVADDLGEKLRVRFGGITAWSKIGDGHAGLFDAEAGADVKPIPFLLRGGPAREKQQAERENPNANA